MYNTYILYITMLKKHNTMNTPPGRDGKSASHGNGGKVQTLYSSLL